MLNLQYEPEQLKKQYNALIMPNEDAEKIEKAYQQRYKECLEIKDGGFTVYSKTKSDIELSKGCQSCKKGKWLCVFVGYNCNAKCPFCPQPKTPDFVNVFDENDLTSHGTLSELKYYLSTENDSVEGISYSGGEPLLYLDKVISLAGFVKENRPNLYQWLYTNGISVNEENIKQLKDVGIDEIRLDLAAVNFSEDVINKIPMIKQYIPRVTVEIPAIPEVRALMQNDLLDRLVEMGVSQLNLSEMAIVQESNMEHYGRNNVLVSHKGFYKGLSLFESKIIYYEILDYAISKGLSVLINNCNYGSKFVQVLNKQRNQKIYNGQLFY